MEYAWEEISMKLQQAIRTKTGKGLTIAVMSITSAICMWQAFPGRNFGWLAFVGLVPILLVIKETRHGWIAALSFLLFGAIFVGLAGYWMLSTSAKNELFRIWLLSVLSYSTLYSLVGYGIYRTCQRSMPLTITVPIWMVSCVYLRSLVPAIDNWIHLGLSAYKIPLFLQIADVTGVSGVTFLMAMTNGMIVDIATLLQKRKWPTQAHSIAVLSGGVILAASMAYGAYRLKHVQQILQEGPRVSVINADPMRSECVRTVMKALRQNPDLVVLPETACEIPLNIEVRESKRLEADIANTRDLLLRGLAMKRGAVLVVGSVSVEGESYYNSAFVYAPNSEPLRYDKVKLVPFGEYIPEGKLGAALNNLVGWRHEGLFFSPGSGPLAFSVPLGTDEQISLATPICFEDTWPNFIRKMVYRNRTSSKVDMLLCLVSDGSIQNSDQWDQHLAHAIFRAVENRVAIARSNTSISAIISPSGYIVKQSLSTKDGGDIITDRLVLDHRITLYSIWGDWFAISCTIMLLIDFGITYWNKISSVVMD